MANIVNNFPGGNGGNTTFTDSVTRPTAAFNIAGWNGMSSTANNATSGNIGGGVIPSLVFYEKNLQERLRWKAKDMVWASIATTHTIPAGSTTLNLRRMTPLTAHTHQLIEGYAPKPDKIGITAIQGTVGNYGRYGEFTDRFKIDVIDPVIEQFSQELGDVMVETTDLLALEALLLEAGSHYATGSSLTDLVAAGTSADEATRNSAKPKLRAFQEIVLNFKKAKVNPVMNGNFVALCSPAVFADFLVDEDIKFLMNAMQNGTPWTEGRMFTMFGVTVKETVVAKQDNFTIAADGTVARMACEVHHTIIYGQNALIKILVAGQGNTETITKELGSAGAADPLNQRMTIGVKLTGIGFKVNRPEAVIDYMSVPTFAAINTNEYSGNTIDLSAAQIAEAALLKKATKYVGAPSIHVPKINDGPAKP